LGDTVVGSAVESSLWVWDTSGLTIGEGESFVEVWAMLEISAESFGSGIFVWFIKWSLGKSVIGSAVESFLWVWDTSGLSVSEGESIIEVWAMLKGCGKSFSSTVSVWDVKWSFSLSKSGWSG